MKAITSTRVANFMVWTSIITTLLLVLSMCSGCSQVDIVVWDQGDNVACHWMPEFEETAICQEYTVEDGVVDWGEVDVDVKVDPVFMQQWLDFQKAEGGYVPEVMSYPTKNAGRLKLYLTVIIFAVFLFCMFKLKWRLKRLIDECSEYLANKK